MTQSFRESTIGDMCNIEYGTRVVRKRDSGTIYPVYGGGGETFFLDTFNRENRVVVARFAMSEKCTRRVLGRFALNDSGLTLSPKDPSLLRQDYLDYFILSINDQIYECARGTAQKNLDVQAFKEIKVAFPTSLESQLEIVRKLDSNCAEVDLLEANVAKLILLNNSLVRSKIDSELANIWGSNEDNELGKFGKISYGYTAKSSTVNKGPKYLRITDIQNNTVNWSEVPYCEITSEEESKFLLAKGDIVFARTGATTGKSYLIESDVDAVFASYLIRIRPDTSRLDPKFLYYFFQSSYYWDEIADGISGSAQGGFNASKLQAMRVSFPSDLKIQEKIVERICDLEIEVEKKSNQLSRQALQISSLRQSLLRSTFTREKAIA